MSVSPPRGRSPLIGPEAYFPVEWAGDPLPPGDDRVEPVPELRYAEAHRERLGALFTSVAMPFAGVLLKTVSQQEGAPALAAAAVSLATIGFTYWRCRAR